MRIFPKIITFEKRVVALLDDALEGSVKGIIIFFNELGRLVANSSGKVTDQKSFVIANFPVVPQFRFSWQR
jgi:hypothetical protein